MKILLTILPFAAAISFCTISDAQEQYPLPGADLLPDSSHKDVVLIRRMHQEDMDPFLIGNTGFNDMGYETPAEPQQAGHTRVMINSQVYVNKLSPVSLLRKFARIVKRVPEMQDELSLTDDQVIKLIDLQTAFVKKTADLRADLTKKELKLKSLISSNASSEVIGEQLKSCALTGVEIGTSIYESANKMLAVLTGSQKKILDTEWNRVK
jgi:LTXXQ motif family protein